MPVSRREKSIAELKALHEHCLEIQHRWGIGYCEAVRSHLTWLTVEAINRACAKIREGLRGA